MDTIGDKNVLDLSDYIVIKDNNTVLNNCSLAYCLPNNVILCYSNDREYWISYTSILDIYMMSSDKSILIINKNLKVTRFIPKNNSTSKEKIKIKKNGLIDSDYIFEKLCEKIRQNNVTNYCLEYYKATSESQLQQKNEYSINENTIHSEFDRLKFHKELWQVSDINKNYSICSTYPQNLILPKKISPSLINHLKNYRDQQRFPILSHFNGKNVLLRCAQPMMGVLNKNSIQDENLIREYIKTADLTSMELNNKSKLMIIDCRPLKNAMAQQYIMGGGSEQVLNYQYVDIPGKYDTTKKLFLNMPNIHIVSSQFEQIFLKYTLNGIKQKTNEDNEEEKEDDDDEGEVIVFNPLDFNWYETIACVLENLDYLLKEYLLNSTHFLIHCTHGWDRTSMVTSLMMICSDPFYRTIKGFFVLIQLEWLDYGFRFAERFDVRVSNMSNELESMDSFAEEEMKKEEEKEEEEEEEEKEEGEKKKEEEDVNSTNKTMNSIFQYVRNKKNNLIGNRFDNLNLSNVNNIKKKLEMINISGESEISRKMSSYSNNTNTNIKNISNNNNNNANDSWTSMIYNNSSTDNCNEIINEKSKPKGGKSPVMIHFLDLLWQIMNQQPDKFEYNELFLLKFLDNVVSGKFSEFINDCDMERKVFFNENGFSSNDYHWSKFFEINQNYTNKNFKQLDNENVKCDEDWIFPDSKKVAIWEAFWKKENYKA